MQGVQTFDRASVASAIAWWRDAGVDTLVEDAPRDWLKPASPLPVNRVQEVLAVPPTPQSEATGLPATLPAFLDWLRDSPDSPEARWGRTRLLPAGDPGSGLMIVTDMPEPGDAETGRLLSGEIGDLFDRMLAAIGRGRDSIWLAPIATVRGIGRVAEADAARLAEIARHQIALIAPRRLLVMGKLPNELIVGADWQERRGALQSLNFDGVKVEVVSTFHPRLLHERPAFKAQAWKDLQLLIKGF